MWWGMPLIPFTAGGLPVGGQSGQSLARPYPTNKRVGQYHLSDSELALQV
jgi:soluble lytic murein transglycosylase-like protein